MGCGAGISTAARVCGLSLILLAFPGTFVATAADDEAAALATFERLFGEESRKVRASGDPRVVADFASKLLESAGLVPAEKAFQACLYNKAWEFGSLVPAGFDIAIQAAERLAHDHPAHRLAAEDKLLVVLEKRARVPGPDSAFYLSDYIDTAMRIAEARLSAEMYDESAAAYRRVLPALAGLPDRHAEALARLREIDARRSLRKRLDELTARLRDRPADPKLTAELAWLVAIELDRPHVAAAYVAQSGDPVLTSMVKLAAGDPAELVAADALALGEWLRAQAARAAAPGRLNALRRARTCFQRFLEAYGREDSQRLKAKLALEDVDKLIAQIQPQIPATRPARRLIDLLRMVDLKKDVLSGSWRMEKVGLVSDASGYARLRIPYCPPDEYDFIIEFTRVEGVDAVTQVLSRGRTGFSWNMGAHSNRVCGFELVNGRELRRSNLAIVAPAMVENGRRYRSVVQVRNDGIAAYVNGRLIGRHRTDYSDLAANPNWFVGEGCLGLGTYRSPTVFHVVQLIEMGGEGRLLPGREPSP